jgi:outer membrane protein TolC
MKNITLIGFLFLVVLQAMDYNSLLKKAIQNNSTLKISHSSTKQEHLEMQINTRLENPSISMEVSDFSPESPLHNNTFGGKVSVRQSLLFPSVKKDKIVLGEHRIMLAKERYRLKKSEFKYRFSMRYLAYKQNVLLHDLAVQAFGISQNIMHIAKKRYEQGTGLKSDYLETKIADKNLLGHEKRLAFSVKKSLNALKMMANIKGNLILNHRYRFVLNTKQYLHPLLALKQKEKALNQAKLKIASHRIESYEIFSEI